MSYPRKLHVLVVEDDTDAIEAYKTLFSLLAKTFPLVTPVFARSHTDAKKHIDAPELFHVVILDLNLPLTTRAQPVEGLAPGEQLLEDLAKRDYYPVPVVLVVSGKLNLAQPIRGLQDRLAKDFWYGGLVNKGLEQAAEIEAGLAKALTYSDVGIHIRDAGSEWFPTLSPREEDLLRRCILSQPSGLGVDVRWWSAESGPSVSHPTPNRGPTKVLMGHFLMDEGIGPSIPTFFKFEPAGNGPSVCRDVGILAQKLGHVKVFHTSHSRQRSLIVTQSVTNRGMPVSLNDYLQGNPTAVAPNIPRLVNQVFEQLSLLGDQNDDEVLVGGFLWEHLDRGAIDKAWNSCDSNQLAKESLPSPLTTFDFLKASRAKHWATRRNCIHGDLNATNVAIDTSLPDSPQAYIFDAAGMKADFDFRDLATLEVTTILFNSVSIDEQPIRACRTFYENDFLPAGTLAPAGTSHLTQNVLTMIAAIRSRFQSDLQRTEYALLIFDAVLRQLSGLGIQPSPNKVTKPLHACFLAAWVSKWLTKMAPGLFASPSASDEAGTPPEQAVAFTGETI